MQIKNTKEYYTEFYKFLVENNVRIGTLLRYKNKVYMVLDGHASYDDFELRIARVHTFPATAESLYRNAMNVKYSDIKEETKVLRHTTFKVADAIEQRYQNFLLDLKFIAEMEERVYYNRGDNKVIIIVHVENDLNKCLYYEVYNRDFNESELLEYCKENSENFYLEYMDFSFLVPIYGYYEKGTKNKDFLALGLKLMMLDRILFDNTNSKR